MFLKKSMIFCLLFAGVLLNGEILVLTNGTVVTGQITKMDQTTVTVATEIGVTTIEKSKIAKTYFSDAEYRADMGSAEQKKKTAFIEEPMLDQDKIVFTYKYNPYGLTRGERLFFNDVMIGRWFTYQFHDDHEKFRDFMFMKYKQAEYTGIACMVAFGATYSIGLIIGGVVAAGNGDSGAFWFGISQLVNNMLNLIPLIIGSSSLYSGNMIKNIYQKMEKETLPPLFERTTITLEYDTFKKKTIAGLCIAF